MLARRIAASTDGPRLMKVCLTRSQSEIGYLMASVWIESARMVTHREDGCSLAKTLIPYGLASSCPYGTCRSNVDSSEAV